MDERKGLRPLRLALVAFLVLTIAAAGASCKRTRVEPAANANTASEADYSATTPPFSTKEPERYQWARVITSVTAGDANSANQPAVSQAVFMARDADKRREDYEILQGVKLTVLRLPEGSYTIYPAKKIYAEIGSAGNASSTATRNVPPDFSADKLVNASRTGARYEKLGTEEVNGRTTTKYRVTTKGVQTGEAAETLIWVDESLGMPIKSESTTKSGTGESKYTVEYKDIKLEADPSLFVLPKDYKKVSQEEIQRETLANLPGLLGGDGEENKERAKKR
ncbi:MAG TPA: hypothetical protein VGC66_16040 [Pyrinomonadaceae bacterium]|jgi:hypothetical protein